MSTLTIASWRKVGDEKSTPMGDIHFEINGDTHLSLEQAEERLQKTHEREIMLDADMSAMELKMPEGCGPLSDCQFRVYLSEQGQHRGQFHLVGHLARDGSLIYTNAVLIDQLT